MREEPPGKGEERKGKGGEGWGEKGWEGKGKGYPPNENPGYGLAASLECKMLVI